MIIGLENLTAESDNIQMPNNNIDEKIDFENALNRLNVDFKSILIMKFYLNFTFEEIANSMQKPTGTIKTWYYKALDNLKELLEHSGKEVHMK